eukprot:3971783-Amphidinium_carterae.1
MTKEQTEPPRPKREPPKPPREREEGQRNTIPQTPGQGRPALSPRLRLDPKNFRNDMVKRDDSYYEKMIFEELRQRSYIAQHPISQYHESTDEIKRVYDGFEKQDYLEMQKQRRQQGQREEVE